MAVAANNLPLKQTVRTHGCTFPPCGRYWGSASCRRVLRLFDRDPVTLAGIETTTILIRPGRQQSLGREAPMRSSESHPPKGTRLLGLPTDTLPLESWRRDVPVPRQPSDERRLLRSLHAHRSRRRARRQPSAPEALSLHLIQRPFFVSNSQTDLGTGRLFFEVASRNLLQTRPSPASRPTIGGCGIGSRLAKDASERSRLSGGVVRADVYSSTVT